MDKQRVDERRNQDEKIYFVTDTSWWLEEGWHKARQTIGKNKKFLFIIPKGVLREIDGLKKDENKKQKALETEKTIKLLVKNKEGYIYGLKKEEKLRALSSTTDEEVVSVAKKLKEKGKNTIILTTDNGIKILGESFEIPYQDELYIQTEEVDNTPPIKKLLRGIIFGIIWGLLGYLIIVLFSSLGSIGTPSTIFTQKSSPFALEDAEWVAVIFFTLVGLFHGWGVFSLKQSIKNYITSYYKKPITAFSINDNSSIDDDPFSISDESWYMWYTLYIDDE